MIATVVLPDGPHEMEIEPIEGSPDHLAIVRDLADDPTASSIIAQIPGHDAWTPMGSPMGVSHPDFPVGHVREHLENVIARLPRDIDEYLGGHAELAPSRIALARYLAFLSPEDEEALAERRLEEQQDSGQEEAGLPTPDEELDRRLKEREDLQTSMIEDQRKNDRATYHGFLDDKSPDEISLIRRNLERIVNIDDTMYPPVKSLIEQYVSMGCTVQPDPKEKFILMDPATKTGMRQKDLTKAGIEYAQYLISLRDPKP